MNHQPKSEFEEFLGVWTEEEARSFLDAIEDMRRIEEGAESPPMPSKPDRFS